jgi:hypothetical protein
MYMTYLYCSLRMPSKQLGFYLLEKLRSSAAFSHIHFCLSQSNLYHNQSQHIYALQQLTHAPQPYNTNVTQSFISNQYTMATISVLKHKSVAHSVNEPIKPYHNIHTKDALRIHHTISKSIHQDNHVTIPELLWKI